jgi:phosphatidylglycerol:prolipoprotein diacylglycerol transferase
LTRGTAPHEERILDSKEKANMRQVLFSITQSVLIGIILTLGVSSLLFSLVLWRQHRPARGAAIAGAFITLLGLGLSRGWLGSVLPDSIPIFGFGAMLFLAFVSCTWLAGVLSKREGVAFERIQDLTIWIFITGILGARILYILQNYQSQFKQERIWKIFSIWDGGLVFYGSFIGGTLGFFLAHRIFLRKYGLSRWKLVDIIAPCAALGLCIGRVGCLLNGCCYGSVACDHCPDVCFPLSSPPRQDYVSRGLQTAAGFTVDRENDVENVEPGSDAQTKGLERGDKIVMVNGRKIESSSSFGDLYESFGRYWERGRNDLVLKVRRGGDESDPITLPAIRSNTLGLHPTQIYESISMALLVAVLLFYYPLKKYDGSVLVLFMIGYAVHRFLNEMLRTEPVEAFGMTLSENLSIVVLAAAFVLMFLARRQGSRSTTLPAAQIDPNLPETAIAAGYPPATPSTLPETAIAEGPPRTPPSH